MCFVGCLIVIDVVKNHTASIAICFLLNVAPSPLHAASGTVAVPVTRTFAQLVERGTATAYFRLTGVHIAPELLGLILEYLVPRLPVESPRSMYNFLWVSYRALLPNLFHQAQSQMPEFGREAEEWVRCFSAHARSELNLFNSGEPQRLLWKQAITQEKRTVILSAVSVLALGGALAGAIIHDSIVSWEIFTAVGVVCLWQAMVLPFRLTRYWVDSKLPGQKIVSWLGFLVGAKRSFNGGVP